MSVISKVGQGTPQYRHVLFPRACYIKYPSLFSVWL